MPTQTTAPVTTVRTATSADVPRLVEMAGRFLEMPEYRGRIAWKPERLAIVARDLLANEDAVIVVAERAQVLIGMLALHIFEHPMSGERWSSEVVWWVDPEARGCGVRLFRAGEQWAQAQGVAVHQMVAPTAHVGDFYRAMGYAPVETAFQRRFA